MNFGRNFSRVSMFLMIFICGFAFNKAHAIRDAKALIRRLYQARVEYRSDSCISQKISNLIGALEKRSEAANRSKTLDEIVAILEGECHCLQAHKLCSRRVCKESISVSPPVVADFGRSLIGNHWRLVAHGDEISLECVNP